MPYHQTRSEIAARIAMRAIHDAALTRSQRQIAALFHASLRTVNQALKRTVEEWTRDLAAAPEHEPGIDEDLNPRPSTWKETSDEGMPDS